jgi:HJR/Mrr/RecB family endonuclease
LPNKNYLNGRKFEYKIRDYFESKGYVVIRSAGSHTPIDLVAFDRFGVCFIQCKHKKIRLPEIQDFIKLSKKYVEYNFYVVTAEKDTKDKRNINIACYGITPIGNLMRMEEF